MKVACLSMRVVEEQRYVERRDAISHDWLQWCQQHHYLPIFVPNATVDIANFLDRVSPDLIIMTGGNDIVPVEGGDASPERDLTETAILDWAIARAVPVFGTCRGMHMMVRYFGGAVKASIKDIAGVTRHVGNQHLLSLADGFDAFQEMDLSVNSFHNQGVLSADVPGPLQVVATCKDDGLVEAVLHRDLPIAAVQWHPERSGGSEALEMALIEVLDQRAATQKGGSAQ